MKFYYRDSEVHPKNATAVQPTHMKLVIKHSKTDQDRLTQDVIMGATQASLCPVAAMWAYMCNTSHMHDMAPLFTLDGKTVGYAHLLKAVKTHASAIGLPAKHYGGHSFRIGGSQALAAAGRSITYIMSYGRWRCTASVLRYVKTPLHIRLLDATHMAAADTATRWDTIDRQVREYYASTHITDQLWDTRLMLRKQ